MIPITLDWQQDAGICFVVSVGGWLRWKKGRRTHEEELDDAELEWKADENEPAQGCTVDKELDEKTPCKPKH